MKIYNEYHIPALLHETIDFLNVKPGKKYIDATLGGGGHSEEIVKRGGVLLGIDVDPEAIEYSKKRLDKIISACPDLPPPKLIKGNFIYLKDIAKMNNFIPVTGILFDLGVSSHQLETPYRGFSFNQEGELDMRMDPETQKISAKDLVNALSQNELRRIFWEYGEEKYAQRYARAICEERKIRPIITTNHLAKVILKANPRRGKFDRTHPATRVFQALRIAVNDELNSLKTVLPQALEILEKGGRIVVLSFHSLEDGIVKRFFLEKEKSGEVRIITSKPVIPGQKEVEINPRARSAKLRVAEKVSQE